MPKSGMAFRLGVVVGVLMLAWCSGAPLQAQPSDADATFRLGLLPQPLAEQVQEIVLAALKTAVPATEEGVVSVVKLDKDSPALVATVDGKKYVATVFRPFLAESLKPGEVGAKEFYVRTTERWRLKAGVVIPADTYFVGMAEQVRAYNAAAVAAQDEAIARSEAFSKAALSQVKATREAKLASITEAHKAEMDALAKQATDLAAAISQKEAARKAIITQINRHPPRNGPNGTPGTVSAKDSNGKLMWQWTAGQGFAFYDGLDQSRQELDKTRSDQKALQQKTDAELAAAAGLPGAKESAIRTTFQKHRRRIIAGETIGEDEMRQDYEAVLGEALTAQTDAAQPAKSKPKPKRKPPIQTTPAPKQ